MKRKIVAAAVQMGIYPLNVAANLEKIENLVSQVLRKSPCDLIVLPEDCITGPIPYHLELVQDENSDSIKYLQKLAAKYRIYLVCGSIIKKVGDNYFNTSFLIDNRGKIILEYQKNNLWHPERWYLTPGKDIKVAETSIGNIGIIICWDLAFPEVCRKLARLEADIICCPSYWTIDDAKKLHQKYGLLTEHTFVNTLCPARAMENQALLVYANGAGEAKVHLKSKIWTSQQIGQTQICTPLFGMVERMENNKEGFIVYEYDGRIAKDAERNYKIREDLFF